MAGKNTYYLTTPIYYPSNKLHIGNAYTTVVADAIARFKRAAGFDVWFLTGTDEHGQKIEREAAAAGKKPEEFVGEIVTWIKELWKELDISGEFIRTTDRVVRKSSADLQRFYKQGDIYKGNAGMCLALPMKYWQERELQDEMPQCGRPGLISRKLTFSDVAVMIGCWNKRT